MLVAQKVSSLRVELPIHSELEPRLPVKILDAVEQQLENYFWLVAETESCPYLPAGDADFFGVDIDKEFELITMDRLRTRGLSLMLPELVSTWRRKYINFDSISLMAFGPAQGKVNKAGKDASALGREWLTALERMPFQGQQVESFLEKIFLDHGEFWLSCHENESATIFVKSRELMRTIEPVLDEVGEVEILNDIRFGDRWTSSQDIRQNLRNPDGSLTSRRPASS